MEAGRLTVSSSAKAVTQVSSIGSQLSDGQVTFNAHFISDNFLLYPGIAF